MRGEYKIGNETILRYDMWLLESVDELHGYLNGSDGETSQEAVDRLAGFIAARLAEWEPYTDAWRPYEEAVHALCEAVMKEYHEAPHPYRKVEP